MLRFALVCLALTSCAPAPEAQVSATPPPARAENGMVVAAEVHAAEAGVEVMRAGGNAVDAAVATGFALAVTYPVAGNVGGGGFMVIRFPDGTATTFDYRETAPEAATRDMFLDSTGTYVPQRARRGALASGVPGSVAGLLLAHERYGRAPLAAVLAPAIRLAEGYPLSRAQALRFNARRPEFEGFESTARYFARVAGGEPLAFEPGQTFRQPDLAAVLRRIAAEGRDGFYRGSTADLIVRQMEREGGLITHRDLAGYRAVEREPVTGTYRGHRVISMPPPSSGGVALLQLLKSVEPYDLSAMGLGSSASVHLMGEAMRRVYADRAEWLGDPDFVPVPVAELTATDYVRRRMADFNPYRADTSRTVGFGRPLAESMETTHYSVVDADGMAVSTTTTVNGGYGSMLVVDGAGFFLNNEMDDFAAAPGVPNMFGLVGSDANAVAPGKRMLSSMTPTIVEDPDGELFMVIGSPGGARIITTVFQVILNVLDHDLDIQAAVAAPRVHHQWLPDRLFAERDGLAPDVAAALRQRGWSVASGGRWSRADGIVVSAASGVADDPSGLTAVEAETAQRVLLGGADPRGQDVAVGY